MPKSSVPIDVHEHEALLYQQGASFVAGVDEAGRGCLAGPVVAAAVILPRGYHLDGLTDSKKLTPKKRELLYERLVAEALAWSVGMIEAREIDETNILVAALKAMRQAVAGLSQKPDHVLIDGPHPPKCGIPETPLVKGDLRSHPVAAASILAKVTRDRLMPEYEALYPAFRFSVHKGYGTAMHLAELSQNSPTPLHRLSFRGVVR